MKNPVFISVDVECGGPIPGVHAMLSLGAVAVTEKGKKLGEFVANLSPLPGQEPDPVTAQWWMAQSSEALAALSNPEPRPADEVIRQFVAWALKFPERIFAAWPAAFDLPFVQWYSYTQTGAKLVRQTVCIKSLAYAVLGFPWGESGKKSIPKAWYTTQHQHTALGDAQEQAEILVNVLRAAERLYGRKIFLDNLGIL